MLASSYAHNIIVEYVHGVKAENRLIKVSGKAHTTYTGFHVRGKGVYLELNGLLYVFNRDNGLNRG